MLNPIYKPHLSSPTCRLKDEVLTCHCAISYDGALTPRQRILERFKKVKDAPPYDHIVIEPNEQADLAREE